MNLQPVSILLTLLAGLTLAGILGWIRRARLVVLVPRLFSHSKISDDGQIVEISVMNRGFKTEEQIELSLNPKLRYDLIGSNNPDATLTGSKLAIPRIGSADDCSVLLQAERGQFSHSDIVNCLSKESKATVATKLEEVPLTAQQRVGFVAFVVALMLIPVFILFWLESIHPDPPPKVDDVTEPAPPPKPDLQGWAIRDIYDDEPMYAAIVEKQLVVSVGAVALQKRAMTFPVTVSNATESAITYSLRTTSPVSDVDIDLSNRMVGDRLLFPGASANHTLSAAVGSFPAEQKAIIVLFLSDEAGSTLRATRMISAH